MDPQLVLAIDTCFASKRWTTPAQWLDVIAAAGLRYVEASADNECDPLYTTPEYLADWAADVEAQAARRDMVVANLYSGHGTYATLGLAHTDARIRAHLAEEWVKPFLAIAARLGAGLGFFAHAFPMPVLQDAALYARETDDLLQCLRSLNAHSLAIGGKALSVEQMYTPHQYPWTIDTALHMLRTAGVYTTFDTGHQTGQARFVRPDAERLESACRPGGEYLWVGTEAAHELLHAAQHGRVGAAEARRGIEEDMARNPQLFSQARDGDLYAWLEVVGAYSPIIHLQQTDGLRSSHAAFSDVPKAGDKVFPDKVLRALAKAYAAPAVAELPPCGQVALTLELFFPTNAYPEEILRSVRESAAHWRRFVPRDGMRLSEALARL